MDDWKNSRSIRLSQAGVVLFALLLAALDVGCFWILRWYINLRGMHWQSGFGMMAVIYLASVFGWVFLWKMWRLLGNLRAGIVFEEENVALLGAVRSCCAWAAAVFLLGCVFYLPFLFVAAALGFMALIVQIVRSIFRKAAQMQAELDLTI